MKHFTTILFLLVFLFSCKERTSIHSEIETIDVDSKLSEFPELKEIHYIPLETNDESLIMNMKKILFRNNLFYIFDDIQKKVFIFDENGKVVNLIHKVGLGPGEYTIASDIDIDENGYIYIADNPQKRIIKYNPQVTDFEVIDIGEYFIEFAIADSANILLGDLLKKGEIDTKLSNYNLATNKISPIIGIKIREDNLIPRCSNHYFYRSGKDVSYYERFSPYIYAFENNQVSPAFYFKSDKYPNDETIEKWKADPQAMHTNFEQIKDISAFYRAGDYIFAQLETLPKINVLYNCNNSEYIASKSMRDKRFYGYQGVYASDGKYFVSYCQPSPENIVNILEHNPDLSTSKQKELSLLKEDSNPIIVLFKY